MLIKELPRTWWKENGFYFVHWNSWIHEKTGLDYNNELCTMTFDCDKSPKLYPKTDQDILTLIRMMEKTE